MFESSPEELLPYGTEVFTTHLFWSTVLPQLMFWQHRKHFTVSVKNTCMTHAVCTALS